MPTHRSASFVSSAAFASLLLLAPAWLAGCAPSAPRAFASPIASDDDGGDDASANAFPTGVPSSVPPASGTPIADAAPPSPVDGTSATSPEDPGDKPTLGDDGGDADVASSATDAPSGDDAPPEGACPDPLGPANLMIDELMIESVEGTGDYGEWLEVANVKGCAVDLRGLHGECPHGAKVVTFDVSDDVWVPAGGFFVVADSAATSINHDLPGTVVAWLGSPGDVLRNDGTTITLSVAGTVIDTLTFPKLGLTVGASLEFPSACDAGDRSDFTKWQTATSSWFPGFYGTPNAINADVSCQ